MAVRITIPDADLHYVERIVFDTLQSMQEGDEWHAAWRRLYVKVAERQVAQRSASSEKRP